MGRIGKTIAATSLFTAGTAGVFAADMWIGEQRMEAIERCAETFEDQAEISCIESANNNYNTHGLLDLIEVAGAFAILGAGYQAYAALRDENEPSSDSVQR